MVLFFGFFADASSAVESAKMMEETSKRIHRNKIHKMCLHSAMLARDILKIVADTAYNFEKIQKKSVNFLIFE